MAARNSAASASSEFDLVITRAFDAPRSLVFKAWTEPRHMARWWGPPGYTLPECEMDVRPGGSYRYCMRSPEGTEHFVRGVFREVVEPERIVFMGNWTDAEGNPTSPVMVTTVTFEEQASRTKLTLHQTGLESIASRDAHGRGWTSSFKRLAEYLATA
jgi:uncharacterized protein YndB with AHSA1/START domain